MRAIIINAEEQTISETDIDGKLRSLQKIVGGLIDPVYPGLEDTGHHCYVNDEGLLNNPQHFFMLKDGHQPLAGNGVILSTTGDGDEAPCTLPLDWVKERVTFMYVHDVREWAAHEADRQILGSLIGEAEITDVKPAKKEALDDALTHAKEQGQSQYESIREMVARLNVGTDEDALNVILEHPLSVQVRAGWHAPGNDASTTPEEFELLLCTGGPAVRLIGSLNQHGEPESVTMQVQDWFQSWTDFQPEGNDADVLLAYARCFYLGDGDHSATKDEAVKDVETDIKAAKKEALAEVRAEIERSIGPERGNENSR